VGSICFKQKIIPSGCHPVAGDVLLPSNTLAFGVFLKFSEKSTYFRRTWGLGFLKEEPRKREYAPFERKLMPKSLVC
jgi:hypothetical protein